MKEVRRAGDALVAAGTSPEKRQEAKETVNRWREIHRQPLQRLLDDIQPLLERRPDAVVAGRIKKIDTIIDKLQRPNAPDKLDTMYDIAGCRIVVPLLQDLEELCAELSVLEGFNEGRSASRDYIAHPRQGGYRCRHLIFNYEGPWGPFKLSVELQVRTELQHAWATAVEMYDRAAKTRLKFNELLPGASDCFAFMSKVITRIEGGKGERQDQLRDWPEEAASLQDMLKVQAVLRAACDANFLVMGEGDDPHGYCLVELDYEVQTAEAKPIEGEGAVAAYLESELAAEGTVDVLLLWGTSLEKMKKLYPNYFGDISMFINLFDVLKGVREDGLLKEAEPLLAPERKSDEIAYSLL